MSPGIALVLLFASVGVLNLVYSLDCLSCDFSASWDECRNRSQIVECTIKEVNRHHGDMADNNPTMEELEENAENVTFSCFSMEMKFAADDVSKSGIVSGCTFRQQKICEGWNQDISVVKCDMCESEKMCSSASRSLATNGLDILTKLLSLSTVLAIVKVFR